MKPFPSQSPNRSPKRPRAALVRQALALVALAAVVFAMFAYVGADPAAQKDFTRAVAGLFGGADRNDPADGKILATPTPKESGGDPAPTKPEVVEPTKPEVVEPTKPETVEPTKPEAVEPTKPETVEPTKPEAPDATATPKPTAYPTKPPAPVRTAPVLAAKAVDGLIRLDWTAAKGDGLVGYKVVASATDSTPQYPDNGYYFWITDLSCRTAKVDATTCYNGGDFEGRMTPGQAYWFAVTAVFKDGKATSSAVKVVCPEPPVKPTPPEMPAAPEVFAVANDTQVVLEWSLPEDARLVGFKVVASFADEHPAYPDSGYAYWITDTACRRTTLDVQTCYNGGDFGGAFTPGTAYWFSVTAVYETECGWVKVPGNAVQVVFPGTPAEQ